MRKYLKISEDYELETIKSMCSAIESKKCFIIACDKTNDWKMIVAGDNGYPYDYTYNLIRWGYAKQKRGCHTIAKLHPYCPNQGISSALSRFLNDCVDAGYYKRTTNQTFNGGTDFNTIWI